MVKVPSFKKMPSIFPWEKIVSPLFLYIPDEVISNLDWFSKPLFVVVPKWIFVEPEPTIELKLLSPVNVNWALLTISFSFKSKLTLCITKLPDEVIAAPFEFLTDKLSRYNVFVSLITIPDLLFIFIL